MSIETHIYENGFRVIYQKSNNKIPMTHIHAFCDVGSVYEFNDLRGVSHFIEHMCFKGTQKLPSTKKLLHHYDEIGAYFNAYTEKRFTAYTLKCVNDYLENSMVIMSDMILNSKFDKTEFRKEEMVVIEENIQDSDDVYETLTDKIESEIFKGSSFENPIDILSYHSKKYDYDKVTDFYNYFYQPHNIVLSIVSNVPFSNFKHYLKKTHFVTLKPMRLTMKTQIVYNVTPQDSIKISLVSKKNMNTTHFMIGFRTLSEDKYILNILKSILSSTFNARLFMLLREKEGLTYTTDASIVNTKIAGCFTMYAEADKDKIIRNGKKLGVLPIIFKMIRDLIKNGVTQEEVSLAKGYLQGSFHMALSNNENIVKHNGQKMLTEPDKKVIPYEKLYDTKYKHITKKEIDIVIRKYFISNGMTICMIGSDLPKESVLQNLCKI